METSRFGRWSPRSGKPCAPTTPGCHHQCHHLRHQVLSEDMVGPLAHPDARDVSYDPGTLNWANNYIFLNTPPFLERLGLLTQELGTSSPKLKSLMPVCWATGLLPEKRRPAPLPTTSWFWMSLVVCRAILTRSTIWLQAAGGLHLVDHRNRQSPHALYAGRSTPAATTCASVWRTTCL